jgi:hypothetical protein
MSHDHGNYMQPVHEDGQRHTPGVLAENERLRVRLAAQEADLSRLRDELKARDTAHAELETRLRAAEEHNRHAASEYADVERQVSHLANLYVAGYGLHGTLDRDELLRTIQEIIANLVGSEEMALFEQDAEGRTLRLVGSFGVDPDAFRAIPVGEGRIGRVAATGEAYLAERDGREGTVPREQGLTACIPLNLCGRTTGVLAVLRLLSHKPRLEALDDQIFDLLTSQVAISLYCTTLHARYSAEREAGEAGS